MTKKIGSKSSRGAGLSPWIIIAGIIIVLVIVGGSRLLGGDAPSESAGEVTNQPTLAAPTGSAGNVPDANLPSLDQPITAVTRANVTQGKWYTVYFTIPSYPESSADRKNGVDYALVADFERALKTIDVAVFDLRLPSLTDALVRAAARGIKVRAIVDYAANKDAPDFANAVTKLEKGGVNVIRNHRSALMHDKFAVIDNRILWTGSMNFTPNDVYRNNNNMLRLSSEALIQNYNQIFERLFLLRAEQAPSKIIPNPRATIEKGIGVENYFSPNGGAQQAILDRLEAAKKSIRVTAFSFTDSKMAAVLKQKNKDGLKVQGVFETRNNSGLGAEYAGLKRAGVDVLEDGNCYVLHSKLMIIDDKTVITGSYNFTDAANKTNDENLLIIDDPALAKNYVAEFNRIYKHAQNPTQCGNNPTLSEPITEQ